MRVTDLMTENRISVSCEVFPPKRFEGLQEVKRVTGEIAELHPSFISVTYGAAGTTPGFTLEIAKSVQQDGAVPLCHVTCVQSTREHVARVLGDMREAGMKNVLLGAANADALSLGEAWLPKNVKAGPIWKAPEPQFGKTREDSLTLIEAFRTERLENLREEAKRNG